MVSYSTHLDGLATNLYWQKVINLFTPYRDKIINSLNNQMSKTNKISYIAIYSHHISDPVYI